MTKAREDYFWPKVRKSDDCWEWSAALDNNGYGCFWDGKRMLKAHRYSFALTSGPIPDGLDVDHICHNPGCVRPDHLRAVTHKQNLENRFGHRAGNASNARGVYWAKRQKKWAAQVTHNGKTIYVGLFSDVEEAAKAAANKRLELFTHNDKDKAA